MEAIKDNMIQMDVAMCTVYNINGLSLCLYDAEEAL